MLHARPSPVCIMKYAEIKSELKALLEKILDRYPDPEEERMDIWDEWIDQMDSKHPHPVDMEPFVLAGYKKIFDECYAELMKERTTSG